MDNRDFIVKIFSTFFILLLFSLVLYNYLESESRIVFIIISSVFIVVVLEFIREGRELKKYKINDSGLVTKVSLVITLVLATVWLFYSVSPFCSGSMCDEGWAIVAIAFNSPFLWALIFFSSMTILNYFHYVRKRYIDFLLIIILVFIWMVSYLF
ncbi:MAG: hypothetical protein KC506_03995 [Nanoarchaeota archaeon]|nr:hypothetical protein [Nanoarchaeota archaeon]